MKTNRLKWIIIAITIGSCGKDDDLVSFDQKNNPPEAFSLLTPRQNKPDISRTAMFTWEAAKDPEGDTVVYDLYLDTDQAKTLLAADLNTSAFTVQEELNVNEDYQWKVIAKDGKGGIRESEVQSFSTVFPNEFLLEFTNNIFDEQNIIFTYKNGKPGSFILHEKVSEIDYDPQNGKLILVNDDTKTCNYTYNSAGQQKEVSFSSFQLFAGYKTTFEYDENNRIKKIISTTHNPVISSTHTTDFIYPSTEEKHPGEILKESVTSGFGGEAHLFNKYSLKWDGNNIMEITLETDQLDGTGFQFAWKKQYTYDNNINPYYNMVTRQFGFDDFFDTNFVTRRESISFGSFFWQSLNNITQMDFFKDNNTPTPSETNTYSYTFSETYYPVSAEHVYKIEGEARRSLLTWTYE